MGVGRTAAYRRVAACVEAGLLERLELLRDEPSLLRATREGIRYAQLGGLRVAEVSPGAVDHWLRCASTAQRLGERFGHERIRTERELVFAEKLAERPLASAVIGRLPGGQPRLHRPDLVLLAPATNAARTSDAVAGPPLQGGQGVGASADGSGREAEQSAVWPIAIEVELTPKAPRRLEAILGAWHRADWVWQVHYYCAPGQTRRAVERAVARVGAADKIFIAKALSR